MKRVRHSWQAAAFLSGPRRLGVCGAGFLAVLICAVAFSMTHARAEDQPAISTSGCKDSYNVDAKFMANPDESVLIAGVIGWCRNNKTRLLWDERYASVARLWSGYLIEGQAKTDRAIPVERLRFELQHRGVVDASVAPFSVEGEIEKMPQQMIEFLDQEAKRGRYTHFAVGVTRTPDQKRMVSTLLLGRRPAIINPLPVCPSPGERLTLDLKLLSGYRHPYWLMTTPAGLVVKDSLLYEEGGWHGKVPLDAGRGTYKLELIVLGPEGPEVAALLPLFVGVERPALPQKKIHPAPGRYRNPEEAEAALLRLTNEARARFSLPALVADKKLGDLAREHAMQLLMAHRVAHRTRKTGTLVDRLRRSNIPFDRALENVSLSPSPEAAHERFMDSPGHRLNIIDPDVRRIGIGIAMERGAQDDIMAVCEVFVEAGESGQGTRLSGQIARSINTWRRKKGRFDLGLDDQLTKIARNSARRLAAMGDKAKPQEEGNSLVERLEDSGAFSAVTVRYFRTANPARVLGVPEILDDDINRLGIGVATADSRFPGELWIAVIFAGR